MSIYYYIFFLINIMACSTVINIFIEGTASCSGCFFNFNQKALNDKINNTFLNKVDPSSFYNSCNDLYNDRKVYNFSFEWSNELNEELRRECGKKLYEYILDLKNKYQGSEIKILGHSHGGNIAAEAVNYAFLQKNKNFVIDEIVFFETPIYSVTENAIVAKIDNEYIIKKIFNVVAGKDCTQVIDCLTAHYPFCMRVFHKQIREKDVINILSKAPSHKRFDLMLNDWMIAVKLIKELEVKEEIKVVEDYFLLVYKKFSLNGAWLVWHNWGKFISFLILGSAILYIVNVKTKIQSLYNDYIKK